MMFWREPFRILKVNLFIATILVPLGSLPAFAQCPVVDFQVPSNTCLQQNLLLSNLTSGASSYAWDFCPGDLELTASATVLTPSAGSAFTVTLIDNGGSYFGFYTSRATGHLYRLDFGSDVKSQPVISDLGDLGVTGAVWLSIGIVKEGNKFFGFIIDFNKKLYRISFGTDLISQPGAAQLIYANGLLASPIDMVVMEDQNSRCLFIANLANTNIVRIKFPTSFNDAPGLLVADAINLTAGNPSGISFIKDCATWYAVVSMTNIGAITKIKFTTGLDDPSPVITPIGSVGLLSAPACLSLVRDNGKFYAFVQSQAAQSDLTRIDFGTTMANASPAAVGLGNYGLLTNAYGFSMIKAKTDWIALSSENTGNRIFKVEFPNRCFSDIRSSTATNPAITTNVAGTYSVSLTATSASGEINETAHPITVSGNISPDISFMSQNICVNSPVDFIAQNTSGDILSYVWDFGDGQTDLSPSTSHVYVTTGLFKPHLDVTATNGCMNAATQNLNIYNMPLANFALPSTNPVCTNQTYLLTNNTVFDNGSDPKWEWQINSVVQSTAQDFATTFTTPVAQSIKLKASIPGCENEITKSIPTVFIGPSVDFSFLGKCVGASTTFSNTTSGVVDAGYLWDFGDGAVVTVQNPAHTYATATSYVVTLTASNTAGCNNSKSRTVQIFTVPKPDFAISPPPFSCNNTSAPFQNLTTALTDSNITGWFWQFNDASGGTSNQQNPTYIFSSPGTYSVTLTATSDAGCVAAFTKPTTISPSPNADFSYSPSCLNLATKFTDLSSGSIQSRNWQIGPATFTTQNPSYTFTSTGNFQATLTVNSSNGCSSVKTKNLTVPVPPTLNFTTANLCAKKDAIFTDVTSSPQDVVTGWNWNFDGNSATGNPATFNFAGAGTYNTKLTTTHASGCRYTLSKNVSINASPIASFIASPDRGEPPLTVQFTNTSQQSTSYVWKFYDKAVSTSTRVSPVYTFAALGNYSAELTATNAAGCSDVITAPITVLVPSIDLVLSRFSLVIDPVTAKFRAVVTIQNNGNVPVGFADVSLILSDKATVNETVAIDLNPGAVVTKTLSFTVAPDANVFLCAEIISEKDVQPGNNKQCIKFDSGDYFFDPYPNPTAGQAQVDWIAGAAGISRIIIHDNMGRKVFDWQTVVAVGLNRASLDLSLFQTGLYYVTIETGRAKKTTRLLIQ